TFEATLHVRLADQEGRVLFEDFLTASSGSGTRGRFSGSIAYLLAEPQRGTLVFFQESAEDGSDQDIVAIPVLLDSSPPPPTETPSSVPIQPQTPSATPSRTPTSTATNTPIPTATRTVVPRPSPTATLLPTNTPRPTYTAQATYTPRPTYTAQPTYTPRPTYTPLPTETPAPTGSPTLATHTCEPRVTIAEFAATRGQANPP